MDREREKDCERRGEIERVREREREREMSDHLHPHSHNWDTTRIRTNEASRTARIQLLVNGNIGVIDRPRVHYICIANISKMHLDSTGLQTVWWLGLMEVFKNVWGKDTRSVLIPCGWY